MAVSQLSLCYILYRIIIDCKSYDLQSYILSNTSLAGKQPLLKRVVKTFNDITTSNTRGSCSYYTFGSMSNIFGTSIENIVSVGIQYWGNVSNGMWISMDDNNNLQLWMYGSAGQKIGTLNVYCFYIA